MTSKYELRAKIDDFLEFLSLNRVDRFYPTALSKHLNITPSEAFNFLLERAGEGDQLTLIWEARCPECSRTLDITNGKVFSEYDCFCGEEVEITQEDLFPVFKINNDFKEFVRDELKKKRVGQDKQEENSSLPTDIKGNEVNLATLLKDIKLSEKATDVLSHSCCNFTVVNIDGGDFVLNDKHDKRTVKDSFNNSKFTGNVAVQSDNVTQTQNTNTEKSELEKALSELVELISNLPDELEKLQSETIYASLEQSIETEDNEKSGKFLGILGKTLGLVTPLLTIAKSLGVPLPE